MQYECLINYNEYQAVVDNLLLPKENFNVNHSYWALFSLFGLFLGFKHDLSLYDFNISAVSPPMLIQ